MGFMSPDGQWLTTWSPLPGSGVPATQALRPDGGPPVVLGPETNIIWSAGGSWVSVVGAPIPEGRSYVVPLSSGRSLPPVPPGGFQSEGQIARLPGARRIDEVQIVPGPVPGVYAFSRGTTQRNLYRIPIQ